MGLCAHASGCYVSDHDIITLQISCTAPAQKCPLLQKDSVMLECWRV